MPSDCQNPSLKGNAKFGVKSHAFPWMSRNATLYLFHLASGINLQHLPTSRLPCSICYSLPLTSSVRCERVSGAPRIQSSRGQGSFVASMLVARFASFSTLASPDLLHLPLNSMEALCMTTAIPALHYHDTIELAKVSSVDLTG